MKSQLLDWVRLAFTRFVTGIVGVWAVIGPFVWLMGAGSWLVMLFLLLTILLCYFIILRLWLRGEREALKELVSETTRAFCFMIVGLILQDLIGIFGSFKFTPAIAYAFLGFLVAELIKLNDLLKRDTDDQQEYIPNEHDPNDGKKEMDLTNEYENVFTPFVKERIQRAGVRLGAMLNAIFKD